MFPIKAGSDAAWSTPSADVGRSADGRPLQSGRTRPKPPARWPYSIELARVLSVEASEALVDIDGRQLRAGIAIPPPAAVEAGDLLVVIGGSDRWWAVGTLGGLEGPGEGAVPAFGGATDLRMHAPRGRITLASNRAWLGGGAAVIAASSLDATARFCRLRVETVNQWIVGRVSEMLGGLLQSVTAAYHVRSREIAARAEGPVVIEGQRIRLN